MTRRNPRILVIFLAILVFSGLQVAESRGAGQEAAVPVATGAVPGAAAQAARSDVLAWVNGTAITSGEVERAISIFLAQSRASHDLTPEARREAESAALDQLIGNRLLYQNGLKLKFEDLDRLVAEKVAQAKAKFPSPSAFDSALKANGLSEPEAQEIVRNEIVVANLLRKEVVDKITIPEADLRRFYQQNLERFTSPATVQISHILIEAAPEASAAEKTKARERAEAVRKRLLAGEDFAALAKSQSSCPSKEEGGDLGVFGQQELLPEFAAALAGIKPGELSPVVETSFGFHVLKLVARNSARVSTFDEAREKIESYLKQERTQQAIADYVSELKKSATIVTGS